MGGCQSQPKKTRRRGTSSRKKSVPSVKPAERVEAIPQIIQPPPPKEVVQEVKQQVREELKGLPRIHEKYGLKGIKTILAKADSPYQSLSYVKINERCEELVDEIETRGSETVDQYKQNSENDFKEVINNLEKENQGAIKKAEVTSRKPIEQLLGFNEEMAKYEDIRTRMKESFSDQRFELRKVIKDEVRKHEGIDVEDHIEGYDGEEYHTKIELKDEAEDLYGRRWEEIMDEEFQPLQFNFSNDHKPNFEKLIPNQELEELRGQIKNNFQVAARDAVGTTNICC